MTINAIIMTLGARETAMDLMADAGAVRQFVRFASQTGLALDAILDDELAAIAALSGTAERVPAHGIVDMLQVCATMARRQNLGVAFAVWGNIRGYGPLSLLWDHCPTFGEALRINQKYVHIESAALGTEIEEQGEEVAIRHLLLIQARYGGSQFLESTLTLGVRVARLLLGEEWVPVRLELDHSAPEDSSYLRKLFRCPISFGADRSALIVRRSDLTCPSRTANAHMFAYLERQLASADRAWPTDLIQQVEQVLVANLMVGRATLEHVAVILGMSPRSLQRHLAERNRRFATILGEVRRRAAKEYFQTERCPNLIQLAHRLGYSDASAVSRYLRNSLSTSSRALIRKRPMGSEPR